MTTYNWHHNLWEAVEYEGYNDEAAKFLLRLDEHITEAQAEYLIDLEEQI